MQFLEHLSLAPYTTLGVGGAARWFAMATTEEDVVEAVHFARARQAPLFVLGGGSNLLVAESGFAGVVLQMGMKGVEVHGDLLRVAAGENWDAFVQTTVDRDLAGVECMAGIPGTVGGTPVQNVGAYGQEVAETITTVRAFDTKTDAFLEMPSSACGFAYRTSLFNTTEKNRYIVTRVDFRLVPHGAPRLSYADLARRFAGQAKPTLREVADAVRAIRAAKGMVTSAPDAEGRYSEERDPDTRSAGSFFRNPVVEASALARVAQAASKSEADVPHWAVGEGAGEGRIKLPAAWLIEQAGFPRGYAMGRAGISSRHTLALINRGGASAREIAALRDRIAAVVQERFGIAMEQEPVSVG
jgi:UDP-N-acetylmuramate dehydrogenase